MQRSVQVLCSKGRGWESEIHHCLFWVWSPRRSSSGNIHAEKMPEAPIKWDALSAVLWRVSVARTTGWFDLIFLMHSSEGRHLSFSWIVTQPPNLALGMYSKPLEGLEVHWFLSANSSLSPGHTSEKSELFWVPSLELSTSSTSSVALSPGSAVPTCCLPCPQEQQSPSAVPSALLKLQGCRVAVLFVPGKPSP